MSIDVVSTAFVAFLREQMKPVLTQNQIELCTPANRAGALLGVYLYDIARDKDFIISERIAIDESTKQRPPLLVSLFFMVTSYIGQKSTLLDDYKLLGRVMQIWYDSPQLSNIFPYQPNILPPIKVEPLYPDMDTKTKIWPFSDTPQLLSLYYKLTPVPIVSTKEIEITRVREVSSAVEGREDDDDNS